ncbi:MAG: hypothetical protein GXP11_05735 [Gammaproteobacteria bacterium]|nr:hypothetical protein [Gammaproteobacteria bacterium]
MAWNGSGVFDRDYNWVNDRDASIDITASRMDAEFDNFSTGIQACIAKNGENAATANLPMATFKHTNVGASSSKTDYVRVQEHQNGTHTYKVGGGTANAHTIAPSPSITAYAVGQRFQFIANATNTGAATLATSGLATRAIKLIDGSALPANAIVSGNIIDVIDDGTQYILLNPSFGLPTVATPYTAQQYFTQKTLTDAATVAWNANDGQSAIVTLAGNRTLGAMTNHKAGATYVLIVKQDGTGSRTLAFDSVYAFSSGLNPTLSTGANAVDIFSFISDGTTLYGSYQLDMS